MIVLTETELELIMITESDEFNEEEIVNAGIERNEEYIENVELDDDGNPIEDIDEYYER